jgi:hypothetical protein
MLAKLVHATKAPLIGASRSWDRVRVNNIAWEAARGRLRGLPAFAVARILEEAMAPGANVSAVAQAHDMSPQQLFAWRRKAHAFGCDHDVAWRLQGGSAELRSGGSEARRSRGRPGHRHRRIGISTAGNWYRRYLRQSRANRASHRA